MTADGSKDDRIMTESVSRPYNFMDGATSRNKESDPGDDSMSRDDGDHDSDCDSICGSDDESDNPSGEGSNGNRGETTRTKWGYIVIEYS